MDINIAVCDDNNYFIDELLNQINKYFDSMPNININIYTFISGYNLINEVQNGLSLDVIFLDIDLKESNHIGTNVGVTLKEIIPNLLIIYVTCFDTFFEDIVKSEPFDFLHKPINENKISIVLGKCIKRLQFIKKDYIFAYKSNGATYYTNLKNIIYFESQHRIIIIYNSDGSTNKFYDKLDNVEKLIEEKCSFFARINKSYYINCNYIDMINSSYVKVRDTKIHISTKYRENLYKKYCRI